MEKFAVISLDVNDNFPETQPDAHFVNFYDDYDKAVENYKKQSKMISNVYLVKVIEEEVNI